MSVVSTVKVKFAAKAYSSRIAELTYDGQLTIARQTYNLADISRTKFRRRGSSVDVKLLFIDGAKLVIRFYGEAAFLVTNKGVGHGEETPDDSQDIQFARLFGRLLANEQQSGFEDSFSDTSFDLSMSFDDGDASFFETPLRSQRETLALPTVREFPVDVSHFLVQDGCRDVDMMIKFILGEISVADEVALSWLPGFIKTEVLSPNKIF